MTQKRGFTRPYAENSPTLVTRLAAYRLTSDSFRTFGDVIDASGAPSFLANGGAARVHHDLAAIELTTQSGRMAVSVVRTAPTALPLRIAVMEQHPLGSQTFLPLDGAQYLVVVAPAGDLDPAAIRVFQALPSQGVNYRRGVWHHPLIALHRTSDFVVIDRVGEGENLILQKIFEPFVIDSLRPADGATSP
jgi:ureidoglycolate lyase